MISSLLIPGLGQALRGNVARGAAIFCAVASALMFTLWYRQPVWFVFPALIWWWNVWDAHKTAPVWMPFAAWMTMALGIGVAVTEFDLMALWQNAERGAVILRPMLRPDFFYVLMRRFVSGLLGFQRKVFVFRGAHPFIHFGQLELP